jgi:hypothetical protein
MKLPVYEVDELFRKSVRTDDERAQEFIEQEIGRQWAEGNGGLTDAQADLVERYMKAMGLPVTVNNVSLAVGQLRQQGAL